MKLIQVEAYQQVEVQEGWDVIWADWLYRPRFVVSLAGDGVIDVDPSFGLQRELTLRSGVIVPVETARITRGRVVASQESITPLLVPDGTDTTDVLVLVTLAGETQGAPYWRSLHRVFRLAHGQRLLVRAHYAEEPVVLVNQRGSVVPLTMVESTKPKRYNTVGIRRVKPHHAVAD